MVDALVIATESARSALQSEHHQPAAHGSATQHGPPGVWLGVALHACARWWVGCLERGVWSDVMCRAPAVVACHVVTCHVVTCVVPDKLI